MVYEYKWNGPNRPVSAEKVALHLQKLEEEKGSVTREDFLDSARPEDSEMHKLFEWDDSIAAEKYRLEQSNKIIHSIKITVKEQEDKEPVTMSAFVIPGYTEGKAVGPKGGYINIRKAVDNVDTRAEILNDARKSTRWFMDKYRAITELSEVISAMEDFLNKTA